jgi:hypothetical protein
MDASQHIMVRKPEDLPRDNLFYFYHLTYDYDLYSNYIVTCIVVYDKSGKRIQFGYDDDDSESFDRARESQKVLNVV